MQLDEDTSSAIAEIGNLCIAGGSNKISSFSEEVVDISVVDAEIKSTEEIMVEVDLSDDCKAFIGTRVDGDIQGNFLLKISEDIIEDTLAKFPKLPSREAGKERNECLLELVNSFFAGFADGMQGMTGLSMAASANGDFVNDIDFTSFPKKVLCYNSMISVGDDRIDFTVYFFSDAELIIPKVLESLGM